MTQLIATDATTGQPEPQKLSLEDKCRRLRDTVEREYRRGHKLLLSFSGGKDSSVLAALVLNAVRDLKAEGLITDDHKAHEPFVLVAHANTRVENPVMSQHGYSECARITQFARTHDLPVRVDIVKPNLSNDYLVNLIGGRQVATLPGMGSNCSDQMKVTPITAHKNRAFKELGRDRVITLIGKRADESADRAANMAERGENALDVAINEQGDKILSPLADFSLNDIFEMIGQVRAGRMTTYSDFESLYEHYRDLNGGECMVTVHITGQAAEAGCGARSGCWTCLRVQNDSSMENMLEDERYAHLAPLLALRNYLGAQHWNPAKRNWLGRSLDADGAIKIAPSAYSPEFCRELLRLVLSIQADEWDWAVANRTSPRFELLDERQVMAIQFLWARYGYHGYAEALRIWDEIVNQGVRYPVPDEYATHERAELNRAARQYSARAPFMDDEYADTGAGLRDLESAAADVEVTVDKRGVTYSAFNANDEFDVDAEAAALFLDFELDRVVDYAKRGARLPVALAHELLRMGVVQPRKGSHSTQDRMLRMANQIERLRIRPYLADPQTLVEALGTTPGIEDARAHEPVMPAPAPRHHQLDLLEALA